MSSVIFNSFSLDFLLVAFRFHHVDHEKEYDRYDHNRDWNADQNLWALRCPTLTAEAHILWWTMLVVSGNALFWSMIVTHHLSTAIVFTTQDSPALSHAWNLTAFLVAKGHATGRCIDWLLLGKDDDLHGLLHLTRNHLSLLLHHHLLLLLLLHMLLLHLLLLLHHHHLLLLILLVWLMLHLYLLLQLRRQTYSLPNCYVIVLLLKLILFLWFLGRFFLRLIYRGLLRRFTVTFNIKVLLLALHNRCTYY